MTERFAEYTFEVGQPYYAGRINWEEGCEFAWRGGATGVTHCLE